MVPDQLRWDCITEVYLSGVHTTRYNPPSPSPSTPSPNKVSQSQRLSHVMVLKIILPAFPVELGLFRVLLPSLVCLEDNLDHRIRTPKQQEHVFCDVTDLWLLHGMEWQPISKWDVVTVKHKVVFDHTKFDFLRVKTGEGSLCVVCSIGHLSAHHAWLEQNC